MSLSVPVLYLGEWELITPFLSALTDHNLCVQPLQEKGAALPPAAGNAQSSVRVDENMKAPIIVIAGDDALFIRHFTRLKQRYPSASLIWLGYSIGSDLSEDMIATGATDYLLAPFTASQLINVIRSALQVQQAKASLVAEAPESRRVLKDAARAALTDASVLLHGESGTGKEVLAAYIHKTSPRSDQPFVAVNCAALPENMLEAMLFGYKKGAFTGASNDHKGKFEAANGGTLFLDEITEMPIELQAKLLRVLQDKRVEKMGSNQSIDLDVRIIAATNRPLDQLSNTNGFRTDLFYRLSVINLSWPALHRRPQDILPMARFFLKKHGGSDEYVLRPDAERRLMEYPWPGNVRELENRIQRGLAYAKSLYLTEIDLGFEACMAESRGAQEVDDARSENHWGGNPQLRASPTVSYRESQRLLEFQNIKLLLDKHHGYRKEVAASLNLSTRGLRYKLQQMRERKFI